MKSYSRLFISVSLTLFLSVLPAACKLFKDIGLQFEQQHAIKRKKNIAKAISHKGSSSSLSNQNQVEQGWAEQRRGRGRVERREQREPYPFASSFSLPLHPSSLYCLLIFFSVSIPLHQRHNTSPFPPSSPLPLPRVCKDTTQLHVPPPFVLTNPTQFFEPPHSAARCLYSCTFSVITYSAISTL